MADLGSGLQAPLEGGSLRHLILFAFFTQFSLGVFPREHPHTWGRIKSVKARQHRDIFVVGVYLALLVLSSLFTSGRAQAYPVLRGEPSVSLSLTVDPVNAATSPFTVTSTASFSGGRMVRHYIKAEYQDRTGINHERIIADRPSSTLSVRWILNNADLPEETFRCGFLGFSTCTDHTTTNARRLAYRGYVSQDGRRLSQGGYAPGIYRFTSEAWIGYSLAYPCTQQDEYGNTYTTTCYSDHIKSVKAEAQGASLYGGLLKTRDLPILLYFYQVKNGYMYKGNLIPFGGTAGTIEGPYSNDPGRWGKPWLGGVLAGIRSVTLDNYFKEYGLKGILTTDTNVYPPPDCRGLQACDAYEAYDPDWVVGRSEGSNEDVVRIFADFVSAYAKDLTTKQGLYDVRSLSSVFDVGDYKAKGFLMLDTPVRTYLFFSRTGLFEENEDLLVIELPAGVGSAMRLAMRWGEMRMRLKNCTPSSPSTLSPCLPSPGNPGR